MHIGVLTTKASRYEKENKGKDTMNYQPYNNNEHGTTLERAYGGKMSSQKLFREITKLNAGSVMLNIFPWVVCRSLRELPVLLKSPPIAIKLGNGKCIKWLNTGCGPTSDGLERPSINVLGKMFPTRLQSRLRYFKNDREQCLENICQLPRA